MANLVLNPTFTGGPPPTNWWPTEGYAWSITAGVATITGDVFSGIASEMRGATSSPTPDTVYVVTGNVAGTSSIDIAVLQGTTVLGTATQAATATLTPFSFQVTPGLGSALTLRVRGADDSTIKLSAPSIDVAPPPDPDPDPDPDPEPDPLAEDVAKYVRAPGDPEVIAHATAALPIVEAFIDGYTRGAAPFYAPDVRAVLVSATARLVTNPEQVAYYSVADYSERPAVFNGWTLPEIAILHRYRRRAW